MGAGAPTHGSRQPVGVDAPLLDTGPGTAGRRPDARQRRRTLAVGDGDVRAAAQARELLPVVRVASGLALTRPDERYWAAAAIAECLLHQVILESAGDIDAIRLAFQAAGQVRPPDGHLYSTFRQLDFLGVLNLPTAPLAMPSGSAAGSLATIVTMSFASTPRS